MFKCALSDFSASIDSLLLDNEIKKREKYIFENAFIEQNQHNIDLDMLLYLLEK